MQDAPVGKADAFPPPAAALMKPLMLFGCPENSGAALDPPGGFAKCATNLKHVAGAAAAGAVVGGLGGYVMGRAMSGMHYHFDSLEEERWWNTNAGRYPNRVYYRDYSGPVTQDAFVADCFNITVTEYNIGPAAKKGNASEADGGNKTETEMETKVVTSVIREMCVQQYREYRLASGGRPHLAQALPQLLVLLAVLLAMP
ncbi:PREDICTED: major prion protein homolog [Tinamus guttatus]|uniref:major prion protein homolog n=1 Tax=Tinamus guttatus TaxID=94827 RepID=UPI00052F2E97|nr:PREDICTED: major prion protein homolog [Tinamus guttatus]